MSETAKRMAAVYAALKSRPWFLLCEQPADILPSQLAPAEQEPADRDEGLDPDWKVHL